MALGHGLQDAQKTMGVIFLALLTGGYVAPSDDLPLWVIISAAAAISLGTYSGGWRIMRTLGRRIIHLDPARGFAAESIAAAVLYTTAFVYEAPISTTHTITSAVMGVGATKRFSAVRWGVARSIVTAWILTFPMAGLMAAGCYGLSHFLIEVVPEQRGSLAELRPSSQWRRPFPCAGARRTSAEVQPRVLDAERLEHLGQDRTVRAEHRALLPASSSSTTRATDLGSRPPRSARPRARAAARSRRRTARRSPRSGCCSS